MEEPFVSIIIPSYNAGTFVREAVDSALAQTYQNREVIVLDDGSTDGTKSILEPYIQAGSIRYFYQPNAGLSAARNAAIRHSRGKYIALLDADDIFLPKKIDQQVAYLEAHPACDISYCGIYHFWDGQPDTLLRFDAQFYSGDEVLPHLVERSFIAPLTMVLRRSVFDRFGFFDESFRRSEDLEFLVRALLHGARIDFLDETLAKSRMRRTGNLQSFASQPEMKKTTLLVFERLYGALAPQERERLHLRERLGTYKLKTAFAYFENADKVSAKSFFQEGIAERFGMPWLGSIAWIPFSLTPGTLLAAVMRKYHLHSQHVAYKAARTPNHLHE